MKLLKFMFLLIITCLLFALFCHFIPLDETLKWIILGILIALCIGLVEKSEQPNDDDLYED